MKKGQIMEVLSGWNFWGEGAEIGTKRGTYIQKITSYLNGVNKIISVFGIRRSGKSYILRQVAKEVSEAKSAEGVLYVNFEEMKFPAKLDKDFLIKIYEAYREFINFRGKPLIILDEIQEVSFWEKFVRSLHEKNEARIIVSGSSARLMAEEFESILAGRCISFEIFPLSFEEFLLFNGIEFSKGDIILKPALFKEWMTSYLKFGGFPEIVLEKNEEKRRRIVENYWETIVIKDIEKRFRIRADEYLRAVGRFLISNPSSLISIRGISREIETPLKTTERFTKYFQIARMTNFIDRFSFSVKEQERSPKKNYLTDISFFTLMGFRFIENLGKIMENVVAIELLRRRSLWSRELEVYYWKDYQQREVDFVLKEGMNVKKLIQVTYASGKDEIEKREIKSLIKAGEELRCKDLLIITWDYEDEIRVDNKIVKCLPLWKWLLE
ncbi:MAG: ATP-binding protein [Thaumarchaeota archaeon]|jgi:predicted AAA+ superfamily ATPase|nr:ATP-binding protein [Nitrososphaerota archaeon]